jgi:hypothetical protein
MPAPQHGLRRVVWLVSLIVPAAGYAQNTSLFPPSAAITNYERILVGEQEALEAGAFVARVSDTTAGWYNPAGLALVENTGIAASATGYEFDVLSLEGLQRSTGSASLNQLPSFLGAVLGKDVLHSDFWRIGFSISKPISWSQSLGGGSESAPRISYSSNVDFSTLSPMVSVALALSHSLRVGAGVGIAITSLSEVQTISAQNLTTTAAGAFLRDLEAGGSIWNLTGNLGLQWDITQNLMLGVMVRFPGLKITSSGSIIAQNVDNNGTLWSQRFFRDRDASFDFKLPWDVNFGLGWKSRVFGVEADLRYHSAISSYAMFDSQQTVEVVTTAPNGTPVVTNQPFPTVQNGAKPVWNWAIGGRVNFGEAWSVHAGFFSDYSPTDPNHQDFYRAVNMYGFTTGARIAGEHLSGSLGFALNWGSSNSFTVGDPVTGQQVTTKLSITSFYLLYAIAYKF